MNVFFYLKDVDSIFIPVANTSTVDIYLKWTTSCLPGSGECYINMLNPKPIESMPAFHVHVVYKLLPRPYMPFNFRGPSSKSRFVTAT